MPRDDEANRFASLSQKPTHRLPNASRTNDGNAWKSFAFLHSRGRTHFTAEALRRREKRMATGAQHCGATAFGTVWEQALCLHTEGRSRGVPLRLSTV